MEYFFRFSLSISWNKGKNGLSKLELFNLSHFYLFLKIFYILLFSKLGKLKTPLIG